MDKVTHTGQSLDWLKVAKAAGQHGVRYRTNAALVAFLNEVATPAPDSEKLREALRLARPIVEYDVEQAGQYNDADWEGISRTALEAIDAALGASA